MGSDVVEECSVSNIKFACAAQAPDSATHVYFSVGGMTKRRKVPNATFKYSRDNQDEIAVEALKGVAM